MEDNKKAENQTVQLGACDIEEIVSAVRARLEGKDARSSELSEESKSEGKNGNAVNITVKLGAGGIDEVASVVCARLKHSGFKI